MWLASMSSPPPFSSAQRAPPRPSDRTSIRWRSGARGSWSGPRCSRRWRWRPAAGRRAAPASGRTARLGSGDRRLVLLAGSFVAVYQASFFAAVADTGVAVGTVVALGSAPAFTGLFGRLFAGERLEARWFAATGLACAGVCLLTLGGGSGGEASAPGIGLAIAAGAGYAGYAVIGKHMLDRGGTPEGVMAAVFGTGALILLPVMAATPTGELFSGGGLTLAVYLGAVTTTVAYILFAKGLGQIGASETATLTLAEPVTAMALGFAVLGERPGALAVAGAGLVLAGLALLAVRFERRPWAGSRPAEAAA